jgi:alkanesulfonate monooxygenase SsuD/methylene tetrahydromethanopterin reductase-like flavin-dependent oxidoreductase (luciferase family)
VGIAVGLREDDYAATGTPFRGRGRALDQQLAELRAVWSGEARGHAGPIGPLVGPPLLIGGNAPATFRRMAEFGTGWIFGGGGPEAFAAGAAQARQAWRAAGRGGEPRLVVNAYACLGPDAEAHARGYLSDYYGFAGEYVDQIVAGALTSPRAVADAVAGYAGAGCDELILFPCNPDLTQVTLLAAAAG